MYNGRIGVGVIGASPASGWARDTHVPVILANPDFELVAVSTSRRESADLARPTWGVPFAFDNAFDLVALEQVDLVVVSVRVPRHFDLVSAAIQAGKAVYCEWPLGNGLAEAERLVAMAQTRGVGNWTGLQLRVSPLVNFIRDLVNEGYVGEVLSTSIIGSARYWGQQIDEDHVFLFDRANGATPLAIPCAHRVDAMCYCLGAFENVTATLVNRINSATVIETGEFIAKDVDDEIAFSGVLEGGALASVHYHGGFTRGTNLLWEINGTDGDLQVLDFEGLGHRPDQKVFGARGNKRMVAPMDVPEGYFAVPMDMVSDIPVQYNVAQQYLRLAEDIRRGTQHVPTFADALGLHRLLDAVERASVTGVRQDLSNRQ